MSLISSALFSVETVPITTAPNAFAHWHKIRPIPPAAACTKTTSPAFTL